MRQTGARRSAHSSFAGVVRLAAALLLAASAGCGHSKPPPPPQPPPAAGSLEGTSWITEELDGLPVAPQGRPTLAIEVGHRAAGFAGCNRWFGPIALDGPQVSFGQLASTMMACDPAAMELEHRFLAVLGATRRAELDGGRLVLSDADGRARARLAPAPKPPP